MNIRLLLALIAAALPLGIVAAQTDATEETQTGLKRLTERMPYFKPSGANSPIELSSSSGISVRALFAVGGSGVSN
jgi:hypothetical protein